MKQTPAIITVHLKLFKQAFPEKNVMHLPEGARVRDLMALLEPGYFNTQDNPPTVLPLKEMSRKDLLLILNGQPVDNLDGLDTPLADGDEFAVFPAMSGG